MSEENNIEEAKFTKDEFLAFVKEIEMRLVGNNGANLHSVIGLNKILRAANINELLDNDSKQRIKDIWLKLKSTGIQLIDPPLIFGLPKDFETVLADDHESEDVPELGEQEEETELDAVADDLPAVKKTRKKKEDKRDQVN